MAKGTLVIRIIGDAKSFNRTMHGAKGQVSGFAKAAGAAGAAIAVKLGVDAVKAASSLNETLSKTHAVFNDSASDVIAFSDEMANAFGLPKQEIAEAASQIGIIGKGVGYSEAEAAKLATTMAKLAADSTSFHDVPLDVALQKLRAGLTGESEPLKQFGVLINETVVKEKALALGMEAVGGKLTEQQKVTARAALIQEKMADVTGDLARTQGSAANQTRQLTGRLQNMAAAAGTKLLPAVEAVLQTVNGLLAGFGEGGLSGVVANVSALFADMGPRVKSAVALLAENLSTWADDQLPLIVASMSEWAHEFVAWLGPAIRDVMPELGKFLGTVNHWVLTTALPKAAGAMLVFAGAFLHWVATGVLPQLPNILAGIIGYVIEFVKASVSGLDEALGSWAVAFATWIVNTIRDLPGNLARLQIAIAQWIVDTAADLGTRFYAFHMAALKWVTDTTIALPAKLAELGNAMIGWIKSMPAKIADAASGMFDGIQKSFRKSINYIISAWNRLEFRIPGFDPPGPGPRIPGFTLSTPNIPMLAKGGIVTKPTLAVIGEAGPEAVVPLNSSKAGGFGRSVTVNVTNTMATQDLIERMIRRAELAYG